MEFCHQGLWPELDVQFVSVTEQWAQFAVAGPSRATCCSAWSTPFDISDAAFPFMACGEVTPAAASMPGCSASRSRASSPTRSPFRPLWRRIDPPLMKPGKTLGVAPTALEALGVMRIEKGHIAGTELNGPTTAHDLGLGGMVSTQKDFIGPVMARRPCSIPRARDWSASSPLTDRAACRRDHFSRLSHEPRER